ncbi:flagellar basal body P-ring formation chaperone FlgA [Sideroxyarcus emersonii]|nr:flagellar basal body P-ring formation chaperone FlgA [Sideroxyarcus emersonii]
MEKQSHALIRDTALAYARAQTQSLPGKVSIQIENIDARTALPACTPLEAFQSGNSPLLGKTSIGVRCNGNPGWSIFVQATIRVSATLLVANHPLLQNKVLNANDFSLRDGELGQPGILTDPAQAVGKMPRFGIGAGQVLREDMLRAPFVVIQGKTTEVRVNSAGISVRTSGEALNNAAEGQAVQVRMPSGQVVSGMATAAGDVEVRP